MKLVKRIFKNSIVIICILILFTTPSFATETEKTQEEENEPITRSLTKEQQAYLQRYVLTYVEEGGKKNLFKYDIAHDIYQTYENQASGDRKNTL